MGRLEFTLSALSCIALVSLANAQENPEDPFAPHVAAASKEGLQAMARFKVPDGWKVELVAAEPLLANPVCFALDYDGKTVYVGETFRHHKGVTDIRDHMDWNDDDLAARTVEDRVAYFKKQLGKDFHDFERACERVRRLSDTDGDGVLDKATVFSDRFHDAAAGIGASLLSYRGDVFYTCIPSLWKLRDEDGDGRAEIEKELSTGYGVHVALLGHDLHGLRIGPDGLLYFSIGDRGFNVPLPNGKRLEYPQAGAVLRCNLDGSDLEVFATGLRNPQDLIFDAYGNLFTGDNNSDGGDKARLVHVVEGSDSGWRQAYQWINEPDVRGPWNDEKQWYPYPDNQCASILPPIANLCDGPSGITIDFGTGMPPKYAGWLFLADFRGDAHNSGIRGFELAPNGAGFTLGEHEETFWGVLATDVDIGTDGAMYVLDWTEGWNQTGKGRIYRAFDPTVHDGASAKETKALLAQDFEHRSDNDLMHLLSHADQRVRQEAQFALTRRGIAGETAFLRTLTGSLDHPTSPSRLARIHAIWGLGMMRATQGLGRLLYDEDAEVRAQTARVLGDLRIPTAGLSFSKLLRDREPRVRMYAAIGLSRIRATEFSKELVEFAAATQPGETVLRHCASLAMSTCMNPAELSALASHKSSIVRLAAIVALRRAGSGEVERFLHDSDPAVVLEAARAIYDEPIPSGMEALAKLATERGDEYALQRRAINANFRLGLREHAARLAKFVLRGDVSVKLRREALLRLDQWAKPSNRDTVVGAWRPLAERDVKFLGELLLPLADEPELAKEPDLAQDWARACADNHIAPASRVFAAWVRDEKRSGPVRAAALRGLISLDSPELPDAARIAVGSKDHDLRAAAIDYLPKLDPAQALAMAESVMRDGELRERRAALRAVGKLPGAGSAKLVAQWLDRQAAGIFPAELALDLAIAAEACKEKGVDAKLAALRAPRQSDPLLASYLDSLYGGDFRRGRKLFREKDELACLRCHKIEENEGGEVGPNLVGVGSRSTRIDMLTSICDPNRLIAEGFRNTIVFLKDETHVEGRVMSQDAKTLVLIDAQAKLHEIAVGDIDERREGQSAMPTDLTKNISREEMRDLIEFLSRL